MNQLEYKQTLKSYITGFVLSIIFTGISFSAVMLNILRGSSLVTLLIIFALVQATVQLIFFLHLKPWIKNKDDQAEANEARWNLGILVATTGIILIVVIGSLWIMRHLNYNMTPDYMNSQMIKMEGMKTENLMK